MQLSEIHVSALKPFDGRFTHSNLTASFSERLAVSENSPLAESEEDFRIRAFFDGISHFLPIDRHCFSLNPLFQILNRVTQEANIVIKQAMKKKEGYWKRLFSGETWSEWAEDKTALGQMITLFVDYMGSSYTLENFIRHMDLSLIEAANQEAKQVLKELPVSEHPLESFWQSVYDGMVSIDRFFSSMLPSLPLAYAQQTIEEEATEFVKKTKMPPPPVNVTISNKKPTLRPKPAVMPAQPKPQVIILAQPISEDPLSTPSSSSDKEKEKAIISPSYRKPAKKLEDLTNDMKNLFPPTQDDCLASTDFKVLKKYLCDQSNISIFSNAIDILKNQARSRDGLAGCFSPLNEFVLQFRQQPTIRCSEVAIKELPKFFSIILKNLGKFKNGDRYQLISEMSQAALHWMPVIEGYERDVYIDFFRLFLLMVEKSPKNSELTQPVLSLSLAYSRKHNALFDDLRPDIKQLARKMKGEYPGLPTQVLALDLRSELALVHCPSLLFGDICENISNTIEDFSDQFGSYGLLKLIAALLLILKAPQLIQLCINKMNQPDRFERTVRNAAEQPPLGRAAPGPVDLEGQENQDDTWEKARPSALRAKERPVDRDSRENSDEEKQATEEEESEESSEESQEVQVGRSAGPSQSGHFAPSASNRVAGQILAQPLDDGAEDAGSTSGRSQASASSNARRRRTTSAAEEPTRPPGGHHSSRR